ncbi:hypothetical protein [Neptunomonas japonica]|uniref:hypothetical protein n=1 Tax=Neptunomonas japonica TaxID=417574 RepID=UPI001915D40D|nr:hypothetical protein [Neptunomonas japonica]
MTAITPRKRRGGFVAHTVQIRIRRAGKIIYQESKTFDQRKLAERWARKREAFFN